MNHYGPLTSIALSVIIKAMLHFKERLNADKNYYPHTDGDQESEQLAKFAFETGKWQEFVFKQENCSSINGDQEIRAPLDTPLEQLPLKNHWEQS